MLVQSVVGCVLVVLGMMVALGLVRMAADLVIFLLAVVACSFVLHSITSGEWMGWLDIVWRSLATGGVFALLSLPVLPFSSFHYKK